MQITYERDEDRNIRIDEQALTNFISQVADEEDADDLNIHILPAPQELVYELNGTSGAYDPDSETIFLFSVPDASADALNFALLCGLWEYLNPEDGEPCREEHIKFFAIMHKHRKFVYHAIPPWMNRAQPSQHLTFPDLPPQIFSLIPYCAAAVCVALFKRVIR